MLQILQTPSSFDETKQIIIIRQQADIFIVPCEEPCFVLRDQSRLALGIDFPINHMLPLVVLLLLLSVNPTSISSNAGDVFLYSAISSKMRIKLLTPTRVFSSGPCPGVQLACAKSINFKA